jgi:AcrR family transcriptional regulator
MEGRMARDKEETKGRILAALGRVLAEKGFLNVGINAVASEAGVDKVLIYRYFGGLPELLQAFGMSREFWPTFEEIAGIDLEALKAKPPAERVAIMVCNFARALRRRPITQEILAWETVERNELTAILEKVREDLSIRLFKEIGYDLHAIDADVAAITALLGAATNYLVVRARKVKMFNTVEISSDEGWQRLERAVFTICERSLK